MLRFGLLRFGSLVLAEATVFVVASVFAVASATSDLVVVPFSLSFSLNPFFAAAGVVPAELDLGGKPFLAGLVLVVVPTLLALGAILLAVFLGSCPDPELVEVAFSQFQSRR